MASPRARRCRRPPGRVDRVVLPRRRPSRADLDGPGGTAPHRFHGLHRGRGRVLRWPRPVCRHEPARLVLSVSAPVRADGRAALGARLGLAGHGLVRRERGAGLRLLHRGAPPHEVLGLGWVSARLDRRLRGPGGVAAEPGMPPARPVGDRAALCGLAGLSPRRDGRRLARGACGRRRAGLGRDGQTGAGTACLLLDRPELVACVVSRSSSRRSAAGERIERRRFSGSSPVFIGDSGGRVGLEREPRAPGDLVAQGRHEQRPGSGIEVPHRQRDQPELRQRGPFTRLDPDSRDAQTTSAASRDASARHPTSGGSAWTARRPRCAGPTRRPSGS